MDDNFDEVDDGDDGEKGEVGPPEELGLPADCAQGREETCGRNYSHKSALSLLVDIVIIAAKRSAPGVEAEQGRCLGKHPVSFLLFRNVTKQLDFSFLPNVFLTIHYFIS